LLNWALAYWSHQRARGTHRLRRPRQSAAADPG
jgi:hypothetical protein